MVIGLVAPLKFPKIPSARFISSPVARVIINWLYIPAFDPFMDAYMITAIPHFILIDREGKVITAKMSRPSDPETVKFLDALEGL